MARYPLRSMAPTASIPRAAGRKTTATRLRDAAGGVSAELRAVDTLRRAIAVHREPPERLTPSQWIERHIRLPAGHGESFPGPVRFNMAPFLREPIDSATAPGVTDVVLVMPTRMGKTLSLRCWWAFFVAAQPSPVLLFDSTLDKGRGLSRKELQPLVESNSVLRLRKPRNRHHFSDTSMMFRGAFFQIYGAQSVAGAAGDTARVVLGNETDKWMDESDNEASMIELVRHRTESFNDERRHLFSSTPTVESGNIWQAYLKGDRRQWFVRCPKCGGFHTPAWDNVKWPEESRRADGTWNLKAVKVGAHYLAPCCGAKWDDRDRLAAVQHPESHWRPTCDPGVPGTRSYQLSGLCGWLDVSNIGELAVAFLSSRSSAMFSDRRDFWNSRMGQPWLEVVSDFDAKKLTQREGGYARGSLPGDFKPDLLVFGVDVQSYGLWWVLTAYRWDGESRVVDHGRAGDWTDIDRIQKVYHRPGTRSYVVVDSNYEARRAETYEAIFMRQEQGWLAANGVEHSAMLVKQTTQNPFIGDRAGRQAAGAAIAQLQISTYDFKVEMEKRFSGEMMNWKTYSVEGTDDHADELRREQLEFYAQLMDEHRKPRKTRRAGQTEYEWVKKSGENHYFDCVVYSLALFWLLQRAHTAVDREKSRGGIHAETSDRKVITVDRRQGAK